MQIYNGCTVLNYYNYLHDHYSTDDMRARDYRVHNSESTSLSYYSAMGLNDKSIIYNSYMNDVRRGILTRWRLSNHKLKIEVGRYQRPIIPRDQRVCNVCEEIEDEAHVIFSCPIYDRIREKYKNFLERNNDIKKFLNPSTGDKETAANFLHDIEKLIG